VAVENILLASVKNKVDIFQWEFGREISKAKTVPAMGAPNATENPQAIPLVTNSRLLTSLWNYLKAVTGR
jgi:hypothetical protein